MSKSNDIKTIIFGTSRIDYTLSFQERKTLGIKVYPDCSVKVVAPTDTAFEQIQIKIKEKAPWIIKQLNEFLSFYPLTPTRKYVSGETHLYLGRQYRLKLIDATFNDVKLYRGILIIYRKEGTNAEQLLDNWYREKARIHFENTLKSTIPLFASYNIANPELHIRYMPTRWGSCTSKGKVILNPELVKAPKGSIEYVIVHELCHLVHHNHNKKFYELQEYIMPNWRKWKERLEYSLT